MYYCFIYDGVRIKYNTRLLHDRNSYCVARVLVAVLTHYLILLLRSSRFTRGANFVTKLVLIDARNFTTLPNDNYESSIGYDVAA